MEEVCMRHLEEMLEKAGIKKQEEKGEIMVEFLNRRWFGKDTTDASQIHCLDVNKNNNTNNNNNNRLNQDLVLFNSGILQKSDWESLSMEQQNRQLELFLSQCDRIPPEELKDQIEQRMKSNEKNKKCSAAQCGRHPESSHILKLLKEVREKIDQFYKALEKTQVKEVREKLGQFLNAMEDLISMISLIIPLPYQLQIFIRLLKVMKNWPDSRWNSGKKAILLFLELLLEVMERLTAFWLERRSSLSITQLDDEHKKLFDGIEPLKKTVAKAGGVAFGSGLLNILGTNATLSILGFGSAGPVAGRGGAIASTTGGAAVGAVVGVPVAKVGISLLGFKTTGIAAGSVAAKMVAVAGPVAKGTTVALLQSAGATGVLGTVTTIACTGGGAIVFGVASYAAYSYYNSKH